MRAPHPDDGEPETRRHRLPPGRQVYDAYNGARVGALAGGLAAALAALLTTPVVALTIPVGAAVGAIAGYRWVRSRIRAELEDPTANE